MENVSCLKGNYQRSHTNNVLKKTYICCYQYIVAVLWKNLAVTTKFIDYFFSVEIRFGLAEGIENVRMALNSS